jgi:hypothetical protein
LLHDEQVPKYTEAQARAIAARRKPVRVFVAYPWSVYADRTGYKRTFTSLSTLLRATFVFAEDEISPGHILDKIERMIKEADFGIYDLTKWNANVTLEYGIARGLKADAYILFNPKEQPDVPSDVRGYDRSDYTTFAELSDKIIEIVSPKTGVSAVAVKRERDLPPFYKQLRARSETSQEAQQPAVGGQEDLPPLPEVNRGYMDTSILTGDDG